MTGAAPGPAFGPAFDAADFEHFLRLTRARSGLVLTADKAYLVKGRLDPVARRAGLADASALLARLRAGAPEALVRACVDAMATHESFFFRDGTPFQALEQALPGLIAARQASRALRVWCAACSSGQEPYSVAMLLAEASARLTGWRVEIIATDMSEAIVARARDGLYSDFEARRGLSEDRLKRWFQPEGGQWRVAPELRRMVSFRTHNLLDGPADPGPFDVIFCRNVLIYFDVAQKRTVLERLARALTPDGLLFLGSAETVIGVTDALAPAPGASGLFQIRPPAPLRAAG